MADRPGPGLGMADWGFVEPDELRRPLVVSPHLDDAVLSCGQFLSAHPGTVVVTVFAGIPERYPDEPSSWSTLCGFRAGDDVQARRRAEDAAAVGSLGAEPRWLDFLESMFLPEGGAVAVDDVAAALAAVVAEVEPTIVLVPMGLANPEHVLTHDAAMAVRAGRASDPGDDLTWVAYQDVAYHQIPGQLAWRVAKLFRAATWPTPVAMPVDPDPAAKRAAVALYPSQVRGLEADWRLWRRLDAPTPEQYWRIDAPPPGWEALIDLV
jgi:LmbE family N-acetylglucosaminyl deacetylase